MILSVSAMCSDKPRSSPGSSAYSTATDTSLCGAQSADVAAPNEPQTPGVRRCQPLPSARYRQGTAEVLKLTPIPHSLPAARLPTLSSCIAEESLTLRDDAGTIWEASALR